MEKQSPPPSEQVSLEDWQNTPASVRLLVEAFLAHEKSEESDIRLRQFLDATPVGIAVHDATGQLTYINNAGRSLLSTDLCTESENRLSDSFQIYIAGTTTPYPVEDLPSSRALSGETVQASDLEIHRSNAVISLEVTGTPILDEQGNVRYAIATFLDISDRKSRELARSRVEEQLRQSEARFQKIIANLTGVVCRYVLHPDHSDETLYMSPTCVDLWEVEADVIMQDPTTVWNLVDPEDRQGLYESVIESARTLQTWNHSWRINLPSGQQKWLESSGSPERQPNGDTIWDSLILDVSDRKVAEINLSNALLTNQALIDAIPDLILRVNRQGIYIDAIASDQIDFAVPPKQMIGKSVLDILDSELSQQRMHYINQAFITGEVQFHEYQIMIDGQRRYEEARIVVSGNDEAIILIRDITDRKQAEISLQESEARYRLLAENINDFVCLHDIDGTYIYVSPSCISLLGFHDHELLGKNPYDFFHPDDCDRIQREAHSEAKMGKPIPITYRMRQKSGSYIWFETLTKSIVNESGQVIQLQTTSRDVTERIEVQNKLKYDALHDSLTGLPNRHLLIERLELSIHRTKRSRDYRFAVLFLDLDRFKVINDSLGHLVGDQLLIAIAKKLKLAFRDIDLVARLGGDEFVILLEDIKDFQEAVHATERIFRLFQDPITIEERKVYTSSSIGIVLGSKNYDESAHLLRDADIAMYRAKSKGKSRYEIFDAEMYAQATKRMHLENDLRRALSHQEFILHYQPIVCLDTGCVLGFEALVRWQDPERGLQHPDKFIAVMEEIGMISQLSDWALWTACQQLCNWHRTFEHFPNLKISVNLSSQDLMRPDLTSKVQNILEKTRLDPIYLTLEITESMLIEDIELAISTLAKLKEMGIQISIDDFGTGYSSLSSLYRLPVDNLKVDRSFVYTMQSGEKNYRIVETIATLSQQLELCAIAEGIENIQQLERLRELGYQSGQGYLFSQALSATDVELLLSTAIPCQNSSHLFANIVNTVSDRQSKN